MHTVEPKSLGGFVRCLSGFFITKSNPTGLTPAECTLLSALISLLQQTEDKIITKEVKVNLANMTNHSLQVITNYINKFVKKGVIQSGKLHPIFYQDKIVISYRSAPNEVGAVDK